VGLKGIGARRITIDLHSINPREEVMGHEGACSLILRKRNGANSVRAVMISVIERGVEGVQFLHTEGGNNGRQPSNPDVFRKFSPKVSLKFSLKFSVFICFYSFY
jgi:hypothetical protein